MPRHVTEISPTAVNDGDAIRAKADVADLPAPVGALSPIKLYVFPPSSRALAVIALADHLNIGCEIQPIDLGKGDQRTPEYAAMNPNMKICRCSRTTASFYGSQTRSCSILQLESHRAD